MREQGLSIEEVDALTGQLLGRPRMATFRLADFTGVDVCLYVAETLYKLVPDDEQREVYNPPEFLKAMVEQKMLGDKSGEGFYKKVGGPRGKDRLVLDIPTMQYREPRPGYWPSLEHAAGIGDTAERIKFMIDQKDGAGRFLWETLSELFLYAAARIPEVTDDIVSVDRTMKAGFNWKLGIFEIWNSIGVAESAARMEKDGKSIPPLVEKVLASGEKSFYGEAKGGPTYFDLETGKQKALTAPPGVLRLDAAKRNSGPIRSNESASLWDLGDGIACLEFHSKANTLDQNVPSGNRP
jgi:3-hydroxyacyl-CoA dehydrogenase